MPAILAIPKTSPFFALPFFIIFKVFSCIVIQDIADANLSVTDLSDISTIIALPSLSK